MSLMCGALLVLGGILAYGLTDRQQTDRGLRTMYRIILITLLADGLLAVSFMPHTPFAWMVFVLTTLQQVVAWLRIDSTAVEGDME